MGEVTPDVVEIARKLQLEVEPKEVMELLYSHDKTWTEEELLLMDEQIKGFLDMESVPGEDAIKIAKMAATNLE